MAVKLSKQTGFDVLSGEDSLKTKAILKEWAEEAKKDFAGGAAEYPFEKRMTINDQSYDFSEIITKKDYLSIIQPFVDRTIDIMKEVLKESHVDIDDVNRIVLVGGSSKGPWVFDTVKDKMGKDPFVAPNVDTFVAAGASYYGSGIIVEPPIPTAPMNYGIELEGGSFGPMILKGETFEYGKIVRTRHFTNANNSGQLSLVGWTISKKIEVENEEGAMICEKSVFETDNTGNRLFTCIGEFELEIPCKPAGSLDIELTMTLYSDKVLVLSGNVDGKSLSADKIEWKY